MRAAINIDDLRRGARRRLPRVLYDYLEGGAEDETTLKANRTALEALRFRPRVLVGGEIDTSVALFGESYRLPLVIAPTGLNGIFWRGGDLCLARAAERTGAGFALSTASNTALEEVARRTSAPKWFQLYPWGGPDFSARLLDRAAAAGYRAAILTVDSLVPGNRERDRRHGFAHQIRWSPQVVLDGLAHPRWLASVWLRGGMPRLENLAAFLPPGTTAAEMAEFSRTQRNPGFDWTDHDRIRGHWKGPLILKGVLCREDALKAREIGVDGVVVSNHGGRQLDGAVATIRALPEIVEAVGDSMTVLVDSGFRRGTDVVKALALGARAVLIGRAALYGLAAAGEPGVDRALSILDDEIRRTMRLLGRRRTGDLAPDCLVEERSPIGPDRIT